ncbi:unnamed protein product, partial [Mesorhabditis spiculigera]
MSLSLCLIGIVFGSLLGSGHAKGHYYDEYSDRLARNMVVVAAGAYAQDPMQCLNKVYPMDQYKLRSHMVTACDGDSNTCGVYTAVSAKDQRIIVAFRGTVGDKQMKLEMVESLKPSIDWYSYGLIDRYFYNAIDKMWPYVEGAINETSSSHFEIKLLTFGEPRVGNAVYAANVDRVVKDVYRVVHKADVVPHLPPCKDSRTDRRACDAGDLRRMYHHGTEVWYNNDMGPGADYKLCTRSDEDADCSDGLGKWEGKDHLNYFGHDIGAFGGATYYKRTQVTGPRILSNVLPLMGGYDEIGGKKRRETWE